MKKTITVPVILSFIGLFFVSVAVFAEVIGLDRNPGYWSRARIVLLLIGIFLTMSALIFYRYLGQYNMLLSWLEKYRTSAFTLRFLHEYGFVSLTVPLIVVIYIWFVSSGTWLVWVSPTRYYADLARGFQLGQLHIPIKPDPSLGELLNPYDPSSRVGIDVWDDMSYYNGRYYLYWGPVPAVILLTVQSVFGGKVGDLQLVFGFSSGIFLAQFLILLFIWNRFFYQHPKWMLAMSIFLTGVAGPVTFMLNNYRGARIYEACITGGQFFFIGGLFFVFTSFDKVISRWWLLLAGTFFAFAVGTRSFLIIPVGAVAALVVFWIYKTNEDWLLKILNLFSFVFPLSLGAVCLGWYNWARFGSISETGLYYQLAGINIQKSYPDLVNPIYIIQNLYNYLSNPPRLEAEFPFFFVEYGSAEAIFPSYILPVLYTSQQITGLFYMVPFIIFSVIPLFALFSNRLKKNNLFAQIKKEDGYFYGWMIITLSAASLSAFGFLLSFFWSAMRYMEDFIPSLMVLSAIGFWQGYQILANKPALRKSFVFIGLILVIVSIVMSNLVAISINNLRYLFAGEL